MRTAVQGSTDHYTRDTEITYSSLILFLFFYFLSFYAQVIRFSSRVISLVSLCEYYIYQSVGIVEDIFIFRVVISD